MFDDEQRIIVYEFDRFNNALNFLTKNLNKLEREFNHHVNIAEEIALRFSDECVFVAENLKKEKCINDVIYQKIFEIDKLFTELSKEHNSKNWTVDAMDSDIRWKKIREIAI